MDLGPAIANAGMTTFLAVIILPASSSHVFLTFFKVGHQGLLRLTPSSVTIRAVNKHS